MFNISPLLRKLLVLLLFLVLQAGAIVMIVNNSYFQQNAILNFIRARQIRWWEKQSSWVAFTNLKETNRQLALENNRLLNEVARLTDPLTGKSLQTKDSVALRDSFSYIPARVIKNSVNRQHNFLVIDKGSQDGLEQDMGVISSRGIIGVVSHVSERYAMIISLLNTQQRFTAELKKSGTFGTLRWDGVDYRRVFLSEIPQHIEISVGDTVVSSVFSLVFPPGIPIGFVKSGSLKRGTFLELEVELFEDFKSLHYVNVVSHDGAVEIRQLTENQQEEDL
ncbi:MAG: rod shape-determining protein MreC [Bacteroidales bacterium]|jgi:rod shape-determining protein MreC|nr:rod shape-determining protein MreC [Bacteroidales bacterium]MDD4499516.1 rod shape-determining protein MreC [Bacteroidales bacterium]MDD5283256.1 rod shape-determining protein MreC [Bacteroidales bacterium]MDY0239391.1 rod shape-determining protein MreC [Bacteroidales bacterium]